MMDEIKLKKCGCWQNYPIWFSGAQDATPEDSGFFRMDAFSHYFA